MSVTIESEPSTISIRCSPIFETSLETEFSSENFTEMLLSYIFGPSVVIYDIRSNNRRSKLHAVIERVQMTSRRPCWRSNQRDGGHVGGVKYPFGD